MCNEYVYLIVFICNPRARGESVPPCIKLRAVTSACISNRAVLYGVSFIIKRGQRRFLLLKHAKMILLRQQESAQTSMRKVKRFDDLTESKDHVFFKRYQQCVSSSLGFWWVILCDNIWVYC